MESYPPHESSWHAYFASFRFYSHQLLAWGYQDSRTSVSSSNKEEEITGFITEAIDNRLGAIDAPDWTDHFCVKEENPIHSSGRTGKRRPRLDILIECSLYKPRHKYTFEAKRLRETSHPIKNYTGVDGIQRFIRGLYSPHESEVAMVGYIQSHSASYWISKLQEEFDNDVADELRVRRSLVNKIIIASLPDEWLSGHERNSGDIIDIYHILIDCT